MSSFLQSAQESLGTGNKAEELDDSSGEGAVKQREFFWDNVVLFVVSSIVGLAAIDVITEFIRGGDVSCFSPLGVELSEAQAAYINSHCAGSLPRGAYIPAFMVIHAILITIPHYLWLNHYGGNFDFFFQRAASMKRLREEGKHVQENLVIVSQLETIFSTYDRNTIFTLYKLKLVVQLLWSLAGILFVISFFFQDFNTNFQCPTDFSNSTEYPFWPLDTDVMCVFEALSLLHTLWWAEIGLLALVCFGLLWALIWCFATHPSDLGAKNVALFSFQSGLAPVFYVPPLPVPRCCRVGRQWLLQFFTSLPWLSAPGLKIKTDLDFLIMKLHRTDSGLGHVFKEVQIEKEIHILLDDDQQRLTIHSNKQDAFYADNALENDREVDAEDRQMDEQDFKWRFSKEKGKLGVYRDFDPVPSSQRLLLTDTLRGAVLGFGQRAPHNDNAISISFGDTGYASTLARVFSRVALLNFSPDYNSADEVVSITQYRTSTVTLVFPENILSSRTEDVNKFVESLRTIWVPPGTNPDFYETSFIVVGPIPKKKGFNATSVDLLFEQVYGCLAEGAVLLVLRPLEIAGKRVGSNFICYEPKKPYFCSVSETTPPELSSNVEEWPARKSLPHKSPKATPPASRATPTGGEITSVQLERSDSHKSEEERPSPSGSPAHPQPRPPPVTKTVRCGQTKVKMEFFTYYYTKPADAPNVQRPGMFEPPDEEVPAPAAMIPAKAMPTLEGKNGSKSGSIKKNNVE